MSTQFKFQLFEQELLNPLRGHQLSQTKEFVGALLLSASSQQPKRIAEIIVACGRALGEWLTEREVKEVIRSLRKEHAFPILSRRHKPAGLWWCGSSEEMDQFIKSFRKQALDELHTLSKIVRENYPALAGQLTLEDCDD